MTSKTNNEDKQIEELLNKSTNNNEQQQQQAANAAMEVQCRPYLDTLFYCYSPANQISTYYRIGTVDPCTVPLTRLKLCFRMKMRENETERLEMYKQLNETSTNNTVWELRTNPGKDWKGL
jgi:hypothetical protein